MEDAEFDRIEKSLVTLIAEFKSASEGRFPEFYNCFVVEIKERWFLVSAEHNLFPSSVYGPIQDHLDLQSLSKKYVLDSLKLQPLTPVDAVGVSFALNPETIVRTLHLRIPDNPDVEKHLRSLDIVIIELAEYYVKNLAAMGVSPLTLENVRSYTESEIEELKPASQPLEVFIVGVQTKNTASGRFLIEAKGLPLRLKRFDRFFAYSQRLWCDADRPASVKGFSGAPVVAFGVGTPIVIGVQVSQIGSSQDKEYKLAQSSFLFEVLDELLRSSSQFKTDTLPDSEGWSG